MTLNPKEIGQILTTHFDELNTEQFVENLKEACPYLFDDRQHQQHQQPNELKNPTQPDPIGSPAETQGTRYC
jgi:hypothetical protein